MSLVKRRVHGNAVETVTCEARTWSPTFTATFTAVITLLPICVALLSVLGVDVDIAMSAISMR